MLTENINGNRVELTPEREAAVFSEWGANDPNALAAVRERKREELLVAYEQAMAGGFVSEALGAVHQYASDPEARVLLVGAVAAAEEVEYECVEVATGAPALKAHSAAQMRQVLRDGKRQAVAYKKRLHELLQQLEAAATAEEARAISW